MGRTKYLAKNIGLLTIGQFGTRVLSFLLVPLYTNILTSAEYGVYDLVHASMGILVPILTVNIMEAILRFSMDETANKADIFSLGSRYLLVGGAILVSVLLVNHVLGFNEFMSKYAIYFMGLYFAQASTSLLVSFVRGLGKVAQVAISGVLCSAVIILCNILFLCGFSLGLKGYFLANILGPTIQVIYLFWNINGWRYIKLSVDKRLKADMIHYSLPTIFNSISWWVNDCIDRYVITWLCGMSANGVYAVASKIPSILSTFQVIFNNAWTLSTVKEFDEKDSNHFFSGIYNQYNCLLVLLCSIIIMFDKILAKILYAKEFYLAWRYVPFLTISIIFGAMSGYAAGVFAALKRSDLFAKCSGTGAVVNIVLNMVVVPFLGPLGAAVATMISYWAVYLASVYYLKQHMTIKLCLLRDNLSYGILIAQSVILLIYQKGVFQELVLQFVLMLILPFMFRKELRHIYSFVRKRRSGL